MTKERRQDRNTVRWVAVGVSTALMFISYTLFVFGFAQASDDDSTLAGALVGIAIALVPPVFFAAAALSLRPRAVRAGLAAAGLFFLVGAPIALLDIPTGLVAGFGVGGMVTLRKGADHSMSYRAAAVAICVVYTFGVQRISPAAGLMAGAAIPMAAIAIADVVREREIEVPPGSDRVASP